MFYVYVLHSEEDDKRNTGCSQDLELRFEQHSNGKVESTKHRRLLKIINDAVCLIRDDAIKREK